MKIQKNGGGGGVGLGGIRVNVIEKFTQKNSGGGGWGQFGGGGGSG